MLCTKTSSPFHSKTLKPYYDFIFLPFPPVLAFPLRRHDTQPSQFKGGDVYLAYNFRTFHLWSVGFMAEISWQKDIVEQSCSVHGSQETEQGEQARYHIQYSRPCLRDPPRHTQKCALSNLTGILNPIKLIYQNRWPYSLIQNCLLCQPFNTYSFLPFLSSFIWVDVGLISFAYGNI